jgi:hypothetical protein
MKEGKASPITEFFDGKGRQIQEWDKIIESKDTPYLLEAKHTMTVEKSRQSQKGNNFLK